MAAALQLPAFELLDLKKLQAAQLSVNTRKGYQNDWRQFTTWCTASGRDSLPASLETVQLYLVDVLRQGLKILTAERRLSAIAHYQREAGYKFSRKEASALLDAARRLRPETKRQMMPLTVSDLRKIAALLIQDGSDRALRDRALLVIGMGSALRRCNLSDMDLSDIEFKPEGLLIRIRKEKNDQTGRGRTIGLPRGRHSATCPVRALQAWLRIRGTAPGPLFTHTSEVRRTGHDGRIKPAYVLRIVKDAVALIGLDPTMYGGHSLRAGFVTAAAESGASELLIASQTGHRSMLVLRQYFRRYDVFRSNACGMIGL